MMPLTFDERPWLILCEGEGDKRFFDQLITTRGIPNDFQVRFPDRGQDGTGGRSKFGAWLDHQRELSEDFRANVRGVLIVSDNDRNPAESFAEVLASLQRAPGFPIPGAERTVAQVADFPPIVIMMLPTGAPGNLETMCLEAAFDKWPAIQAPLDTFVQATPANGWHIGKQSKMRLQTVIAATCEPRPESGFVGHWRESNNFHLPLAHATFDEVEQFLRGFGNLLASD